MVMFVIEFQIDNVCIINNINFCKKFRNLLNNNSKNFYVELFIYIKGVSAGVY